MELNTSPKLHIEIRMKEALDLHSSVSSHSSILIHAPGAQGMYLLIKVEGKVYKIGVPDPRSTTVQFVCDKALIHHIRHILKLSRIAALSVVEQERIQIEKVEEDGAMLELDESIAELQLQNGTLLHVVLEEGSREFLHNSDPAKFIPRGNKLISVDSGFSTSTTSGRVQKSIFVLVEVNGLTYKIKVKDPANETLLSVCSDATIRHLRDAQNLQQEEAADLLKNGLIRIVRVSEQGAILDLQETMAESELESNSVLQVTLEEHNFSHPHPKTSAELASIYSPSDILRATDNFSKKRMVGKGGQAIVYRGNLFGTLVAVKRYISGDFHGMETELQILQRVRHPNLLLVMGSCPGERCIVSEYMAGGSLHDRLKDSGTKFNSLTWIDRFRIIKELVSAILFLHSSNILHRDLKPSNVLLDSRGAVKVADMGVAKLSVTTQVASKGTGTPGYMDPHYISTGAVSRSVDIYAIGLIILQLCTHEPNVAVVHKVLGSIGRNANRNSCRALSAIKPHLAPRDKTISEPLVLELVSIGLQCVATDPDHRPALMAVMEKLNSKKFSSNLGLYSIEDSVDAFKLAGSKACGLDLQPAVEYGRDMGAMGYDAVPRHYGTRCSRMDADSDYDILDLGSETILPRSLFSLGEYFENGDGDNMDFLMAAHWYDLAASQGNSDGKSALNRLLDNMYNCIRNSPETAKSREYLSILEASSSLGIAMAQDIYGQCLYHGEGVDQDWIQAVKLFSSASRQGLASAQCNLGYCYKHGHGVEASMSRAVELYSMSAAQGHAIAQNNLGYCYRHGEGVEEDLEKAVELYLMAAEQGDDIAQNNLGHCYEHGHGVDMDKRKAAELYARSAEQGNSIAQVKLGDCFYFGQGVEVDLHKAVELYFKSALQGNARAQNNLGDCYRYGNGIENSNKKAFDWYSKAAEQGNAEAQNNLGEMCHNRGGVVVDMMKAVEQYRLSAEQGFPAAQFNLGYCYQHGHGVTVDKTKAVELYYMAAEGGNATAQFSIGECYQFGDGVDVDMEKAVGFYSLSAQQGNAKAQNSLGQCYHHGRGVEVDQVRAVELYSMAALQDLGLARYNLGYCYEFGHGVEVDKEMALELYSTLVGHFEARVGLKRIQSKVDYSFERLD